VNRLPGKRHLPSPLLRKIFPPRIARFDQCDLLRPSPTLELFLPGDCPKNVVEAFVVDQSIAMIFLREARNLTTLVLPHPTFETVCDPDVKCSASAHDDLRPIRMIHAEMPFQARVIAIG